MAKKIIYRLKQLFQFITMHKVNDSYYYDLKKNFKDNEPRDFIGGRWDEVGKLQFNFMKNGSPTKT